jgi:hypothetical protein
MEADTVYGALNDNHRDLRRDTATSIGNVRTTQVNFERNINRSWTDTLARVDENERVIQATLAKLSGSLGSLVTILAATTDRHGALLKEISTSVQKQGSQLEAQSGILRTITRHNETRDARLLNVEGDLVAVNRTVATFDARLQGLRTTTEATTSALRTDVNDVRARVIPDLRRDLHNELQDSTRGLTAAVQAVDTAVQEALARIHAPPAGVQAASSTPAPVHSPTATDPADALSQQPPAPAPESATAPIVSRRSNASGSDASGKACVSRCSNASGNTSPESATVPIDDLPAEDSTVRTDISAGSTAARGVPNNPRVGFPSFWSPDHRSHDSWYHGEHVPCVTPGDDPALRYRSHESRPHPLDTPAASSGAPRGDPKGGPIVSP